MEQHSKYLTRELWITTWYNNPDYRDYKKVEGAIELGFSSKTAIGGCFVGSHNQLILYRLPYTNRLPNHCSKILLPWFKTATWKFC